MVTAGCVFVAGIHTSRPRTSGSFVAGIHTSRPRTSGSFESVRWNACVHRLDLGLYSHPKEFVCLFVCFFVVGFFVFCCCCFFLFFFGGGWGGGGDGVRTHVSYPVNQCGIVRSTAAVPIHSCLLQLSWSRSSSDLSVLRCCPTTPSFLCLSGTPRWPSGKASASRAEDPGFESRLRRDIFGVESYQ